MERVDHIHIVKVRGSCLVREVHRVRQRKVPDREGLELCISRAHAADVFMIQLGKAGRHLSAAGSGSRHHHERPGRLDIFVAAEAVFTHDFGNIGGIAVNLVVTVYAKSEALQFLLVRKHSALLHKLGEHDASDVHSVAAERVNQTKHVKIVCNT